MPKAVRERSGAGRKRRVMIWGAGGHALVVADIVRLAGEYELAGFVDRADRERRGGMLLGLPIVGGRDELGGVEHFIVAIGDCATRLALANEGTAMGLRLATAVHPRATIARDVELGAGSVVAAGAVINPATRIGENVIVNTAASIDHECVLEDGVHVSPGARLAGRVRVGRGAWIGIGATVIEEVRIGAGALVGAGAVVVGDVAEGVVAVGIPARPRCGSST